MAAPSIEVPVAIDGDGWHHKTCDLFTREGPACTCCPRAFTEDWMRDRIKGLEAEVGRLQRSCARLIDSRIAQAQIRNEDRDARAALCDAIEKRDSQIAEKDARIHQLDQEVGELHHALYQYVGDDDCEYGEDDDCGEDCRRCNALRAMGGARSEQHRGRITCDLKAALTALSEAENKVQTLEALIAVQNATIKELRDPTRILGLSAASQLAQDHAKMREAYLKETYKERSRDLAALVRRLLEAMVAWGQMEDGVPVASPHDDIGKAFEDAAAYLKHIGGGDAS